MATAAPPLVPVVSGTTPLPTSIAGGRRRRDDRPRRIAGNFPTFLQLLTTQLRTRIRSTRSTPTSSPSSSCNSRRSSSSSSRTTSSRPWSSLQKTAQSTQALDFVGKTVDGRRRHRGARRRHGRPGAQRPQAGHRHCHHHQCSRPDGLYRQLSRSTPARRISSGTAAATTARNGRTATTRFRSPPRMPAARRWRSRPRSRAWSNSVDLTQSPPLLSIGGQSFTLDKIKRVISALDLAARTRPECGQQRRSLPQRCHRASSFIARRPNGSAPIVPAIFQAN